ncbi:MAG: 2OG-Fe(II) oxygenase [Micrococcales bacterium]|nr:2OG-Fe(II) oxygenase [Micrococcales bacterium]
MAQAARERLARLLGGADPVFSTHGTLPTSAMTLTVAGLSTPVKLPIRAAQAKQLVSVARPAVFGRREHTVSDLDVRDTWVIDSDQVSFGDRWVAELQGVLDTVRADFGLAPGTRFEARPHSLLVYGKGQFFAPHQDSEKNDAMIATLVVVLPSVHTGGELVVDHAGESQTFHGASDEIRYVAFYADCRHEVKPVRSGYRVTLTFDLLVTEAPTQVLGPVDEAAALLTEHFAVPGERWGRETKPPDRLVFLLDHEYSQRGLERGKLKGADTERVALVRSAAQQAGCDTALALAEIQETWDAYDVYPSRYWDDDTDSGVYEINELIDGSTVLGWWTLAGGESISLRVGDEEVCASTANIQLTPYESDYQGYTGNEGNTLDRWYRRAAVVVWPVDRAFAVRAEAAPAWALEQVAALLGTGETDQARSQAHQAAPFWYGLSEAHIALALDVARRLDDADAATDLLKGFALEAYTPEHAVAAAALAARYGDAWADALVTHQVDDARHSYGYGYGYGPTPRRSAWTTGTFPAWAKALRDAGAVRLAASYGSSMWGSALSRLVQILQVARRERRLDDLAEHACHIASVLVVADQPLCTQIARDVAPLGDDVVAALVPALCARSVSDNPGLAELVAQTSARAQTIADRPVRTADDWSIAWTGCGCDLCTDLEAFLRSATIRTKEWPLRKDRRQHIHTKIDDADLPVAHRTRRQGSPYTLVLTKTSDLFDRETQDRDSALARLADLVEAYPSR